MSKAKQPCVTPSNKVFINAAEAFILWQEKDLPGTYPTFLKYIKKHSFTLQPTKRVLLIKKDEFLDHISKKGAK